MVLGIFKISLRLKDRHVFMRQPAGILNVFNTLTLKKIFWKTKTFFKQLKYYFLIETTKIENTYFHSKLICEKLMLREIEWQLQNGPFTKCGVLPVTTVFFWEICSSFRTS